MGEITAQVVYCVPCGVFTHSTSQSITFMTSPFSVFLLHQAMCTFLCVACGCFLYSSFGMAVFRYSTLVGLTLDGLELGALLLQMMYMTQVHALKLAQALVL